MNILILDSTFTQVSLLSNYISLHYNRQFSDKGDFQICVNLNTLNAQELTVGRIVYLDSHRVGIIEYVEIIRETNSDEEILYAGGIELKDIISRRVTIPPEGYARAIYMKTKPLRRLLEV